MLLGDNLARLGPPEVLLGEATSGPLAGALEHLPLLADNGDLLGLPLADNSLLGSGLPGGLLGGPGAGPLLGRGSSSGSLSFTGHV